MFWVLYELCGKLFCYNFATVKKCSIFVAQKGSFPFQRNTSLARATILWIGSCRLERATNGRSFLVRYYFLAK